MVLEGCPGAAICCEPGDGMQGCLQCGRPGRLSVGPSGRAKVSSPCATRGDEQRRLLPLLCWFFDAGNDETLRRLNWQASKKRQGTKSREVWHPAEQRAL